MKFLSLSFAFLLSAFLLLPSCSQSKTIQTDSSHFSSLQEKQELLEKYLTFRRNYQRLEYQLSFIDGGDGGVPGASSWDVRVFAQVPPEELDLWIDGIPKVDEEQISSDWISSIPNSPALPKGIEWYQEERRVVGISRSQAQVWYRINSDGVVDLAVSTSSK